MLNPLKLYTNLELVKCLSKTEAPIVSFCGYVNCVKPYLSHWVFFKIFSNYLLSIK